MYRRFATTCKFMSPVGCEPASDPKFAVHEGSYPAILPQTMEACRSKRLAVYYRLGHTVSIDRHEIGDNSAGDRAKQCPSQPICEFKRGIMPDTSVPPYRNPRARDIIIGTILCSRMPKTIR